MIGRTGHGAFSPELDPRADAGRPMAYRIRIAGQLAPAWADWFAGMTITLDGGDTLLTGPVVDQAALHGLLHRVRDLGLPLVSVCPVGSDPPTTLGTGRADVAGTTEGHGQGRAPRGRRPGEK